MAAGYGSIKICCRLERVENVLLSKKLVKSKDKIKFSWIECIFVNNFGAREDRCILIITFFVEPAKAAEIFTGVPIRQIGRASCRERV